MATMGLVPVMVNAGVAVLPAIGAALLTMAGALARPKVLLGALVMLLVAAGLWALWPAQPPVDVRRDPGVRTAEQWIALAVKIDRFDGDIEAAMGVDPTAAATVASSANGGGAVAAPADSPVIFRHNPERNGYAGGDSPTGLKPLWAWQDPEDEFAMYPATVAVDGEWVYGAGVSLSPPDSYGSVFCLNAKTGKERWVAFEVPAENGQVGTGRPFKGIFSSPAITADGAYLVVGQGLHPDYNSDLLCIETATGKLHWRVPTPLHIEGSPAVEGDLAVAGAGAVEIGEDLHVRPGDNPGFVLAVRISDGKLLWTHQVNDPESSPVLKDGVVYIGSGVNGNAVVALRTETDEQLEAAGLSREIWRTPTPYAASGAVTLTDDLVLIGCGTGDFINPGDTGIVIALDRETGQERWRTDEGAVRGLVLAPVAVRGNVGIVVSAKGDVVAIDLSRQGKTIWRSTPNDNVSILAGAAFTGPYVYVVSTDSRLTVLNAADGASVEHVFLNRADRPGELRLSVSGPIVRDNRVYVGSETGGIHCLRGTEKEGGSP